MFLAYGKLVADPRREAERICRFFGIEYSPHMVANYSEAARTLIKSEEHWKQNNLKEISRVVRKTSQFYDVLTSRQQEEAEKIINSVDLGAFAMALND